MYSQKHLYPVDENSHSTSSNEPYPIGRNDKDIINNIKNKNNYNQGLQGKKNNRANFEQRDYEGFDFTKLYANAEVFI